MAGGLLVEVGMALSRFGRGRGTEGEGGLRMGSLCSMRGLIGRIGGIGGVWVVWVVVGRGRGGRQREEGKRREGRAGGSEERRKKEERKEEEERWSELQAMVQRRRTWQTIETGKRMLLCV